MKKILFIIPILIILGFLLIPKEISESPEDVFIIDNEIELENIKTAVSIEEKELQPKKTRKENLPAIPIILDFKNDSNLDFSSFKPSYNLLVNNSLQQEHKDLSQFIKNKESENWCIDFINWIIRQTNKTEKYIDIQINNNYSEFQNYITSQESYYRGNDGCIPQIGDIILYDKNSDGIVDEISIISFYEDHKVTDIAGNRWCDEHQKYEVLTETKSISKENILGIYKPTYDIVRLKPNEPANLPMNAVDTVAPIKNEKHIQILAENGIEVIARYINPEGRTPLALEDVKLFSKYGIRTMMIYQINRADPYKGYDKGIEFGTKALEYAKNLKAPKGTPIFFCCDCPSDFSGFGKVAEFINGVNDAMKGEYTVGLYGGFYVNEAMYNIDMIDAYWQCWGLSDKYISNNYDIMQWSSGDYYFEGIPHLFDANHVKNPEKVSFVLEEELWTD